jgi:cell wall-associated NlpC family hydrolase
MLVADVDRDATRTVSAPGRKEQSNMRRATLKRAMVIVIGLAMALTLALPGVAAADSYTRPPGNQKFVDIVIARAMSARGVPFTYGGGDINGPTRGTPEPASAAPALTTPGVPGIPDPAGTPPTNAPLTNPTPGLPLLTNPAPLTQQSAPVADVVGFDASGLMVYAFGGVGVKLPRSSGQQYNAGQHVLPSQALPGDLIFYGPDGSQSVALFIGNGQMVETTDKGVAVSPVRTNGMTPLLTRIIA